MSELETVPVTLKRYIVCGGRSYTNREFLNSKLDQMLKHDWNFVLVHGAAPGADRMAGEWGNARSVVVEPHPADWNTYGRRAGSIRNQDMLDTGVDGVVAFPGGVGTADMVVRAKRAGVPVWDLRGSV